jgi:hypothetical protein
VCLWCCSSSPCCAFLLFLLVVHFWCSSMLHCCALFEILLCVHVLFLLFNASLSCAIIVFWCLFAKHYWCSLIFFTTHFSQGTFLSFWCSSSLFYCVPMLFFNASFLCVLSFLWSFLNSYFPFLFFYVSVGEGFF